MPVRSDQQHTKFKYCTDVPSYSSLSRDNQEKLVHLGLLVKEVQGVRQGLKVWLDLPVCLANQVRLAFKGLPESQENQEAKDPRVTGD